MPHTYLAVTIGPITKTLAKARSTKELWAASYLISYLMKQLVISFRDTHTFISPLANDQRLFEPHEGAGLFPDRLIFKWKDKDDFVALTKRIEEVVMELVNGKGEQKGVAYEINNQLIVDYYTIPQKERPTDKPPKRSQAEILTYFQQYFKIYALEIELKEGDNVRERIDHYLNVLELQTPLPAPESIDYIAALFRGIYGRRSVGSLLLEDGFGPKRGRPFPSLFEIATREFFRSNHRYAYMRRLAYWLSQTQAQTRKLIRENKEPVSDLPNPDEILLKSVKSLMGNEFRRRHKYIAIVQADGDGMGKVNQAIFGGGQSTEVAEELLADVDKRLLTFSLSAVDTIDAFGGQPIYLGGDDLLFFAPVMGYIDDKRASVFELVKVLSASFDSAFSDEEYNQKMDIRPTLSFGVSITYYKYPMFEALDKAWHLLKDVAKEVAGKNALAFQVLKHSGQEFGTAYRKQGEVFKTHMATLLEKAPDDDDAFLTSVQHALTNQQNLLCILLKDATDAQIRLTNFFANNFNEPVHSRKETFLLTVADLLFDAYAETKDGLEAIKMAHATLRFVQFLHQPDLDDDE